MKGTCLRIDAPGEFHSRLPRFEYHSPATLEEASALLAGLGDRGRALAGGTDLLVRLARRVLTPEALVGLKRIPDLDRVAFDGKEGLTLGATALLADIAEHPDVVRLYPALAHAARHTATVQVRNMATIGGNLCNASPCADNVPTLLALDARVRIAGRGAERSIPLADLFGGPGVVRLEPGEILTAIHVAPSPPRSGTAYERISARGRVDLSAVSVAAFLRMDGRRCAGAAVALGAVAPTAIRARSAEALLRGQEIRPELLDEAGRAAARESEPITDLRATREYRREMVRVLTRRALARAFERATSGGDA